MTAPDGLGFVNPITNTMATTRCGAMLLAMTTITDDVRSLTRADLDWVLDVGAARRERIVHYAPTFWRPAATAREAHEKFLGNQIDNPDVVSLRTNHGFMFGALRGDQLVVDDMALDDEEAWNTAGEQLLHAAARDHDLRFVCPVPESGRTSTAITLGMTNAETWWHRDITPAEPATSPDDQPSASKGQQDDSYPRHPSTHQEDLSFSCSRSPAPTPSTPSSRRRRPRVRPFLSSPSDRPTPSSHRCWRRLDMCRLRTSSNGDPSGRPCLGSCPAARTARNASTPCAPRRCR